MSETLDFVSHYIYTSVIRGIELENCIFGTLFEHLASHAHSTGSLTSAWGAYQDKIRHVSELNYSLELIYSELVSHHIFQGLWSILLHKRSLKAFFYHFFPQLFTL